MLATQVALTSGAAPLLIYRAFRKQTWLDLSDLTWQRLFQLSLAFVVLSGVLCAGIIFLFLCLPESEVRNKIDHAFCRDILIIFGSLSELRMPLMSFTPPKSPVG